MHLPFLIHDMNKVTFKYIKIIINADKNKVVIHCNKFDRF